MTTTGRTTRRIITATAIAAVSIPAFIAVSAPANAATTATTKLLQSMAAEEKLAHDVYVTLGNIYHLRVLDNISASETTHLNRLRELMRVYGITDLTAGDAVGKFDDPAVQKLYDQLITQGKASFAGMVASGIAVEKLDIADLDKALATKPAADITFVLKSLRAGSVRHLANFQRLA
jgi:hypothetical protein